MWYQYNVNLPNIFCLRQILVLNEVSFLDNSIRTDTKHRLLRRILFLIRSFMHLNALIKNKTHINFDVLRKSWLCNYVYEPLNKVNVS